MNRLPSYDVKLIIGDANAKVGKELIWRKTAGKESLHDESNDNGTRLLSLAVAGDMNVVSTMFPRKNIHKETWYSPNGQVKNQIDHVLIDKRHRWNITNVRSIRGAECGSDHNLVLVKIYQRIAVERKDKLDRKPSIDWEKLKDPVKASEFRSTISMKFSYPREEERNIENQWKKLKNTLQECAKEICGEKENKKKKPWFDNQCCEMVIMRKAMKEKWLNSKVEVDRKAYTEQNKNTTRTLRQKKRNWLKSLMEKAEEDRTANNSRDFYRTTRFFRQEYKPRAYGVKDKDGIPIIQQKEGLDRWKEYFEELLNVETREEDNEEAFIYQNVQPELEVPTLEEVSKIIEEMKKNKAPGEDGINMEIIKAGGLEIANTIYELIKEIWNEKTIPNEWTEAIVIPIHKKGDKEDCNNYRGISLLNCTYKIFSKILLKRLETYTTSIIEEHQAGFIKGRSTTDQIYIVKETIAKYWEFDRECFLLFVDFSKAYDCLYRQKIWDRMESFGIPQDLIQLVKLSVNQSKCKVKVNGETSTTFDVRSGVRQGDGISPTLFNIALEGALQAVNKTSGGIKLGKEIKVLAFADDVVLIAESLNDLIELTKVLIKETNEVGLKINETKTKVMHVQRNKENDFNHINIENYKFERVSTFKYLGVTLTEDNKEEVEIQTRLNSANRSLHACNKLMSSKLLSKCSKLKLYKSIIRPVLTYGSENWIMTKQTEKKLVTFENKVLRKIYGPTLEDGNWRIKHNKEIRDLFNQPDIVSEVKRGRLRWMGHVIRREETSNVKNIWKGRPEGRRPRGRPKKRWWDEVKNDMDKINLTIEDATDRFKWRRACDEAKYRLGYKWPWQ
ncbi:hypothetical protein WDU94_003506 [Cyamophila willieti]